jgi:hypothetical protein
MELLEIKYHKPIEDILLSGSLKTIEAKYKIDFTTASKWRKLLASEALRQVPINTLKSVVEGICEDQKDVGVPSMEPTKTEGDNL